jgi:cyclic pyranopterin phosphate synthase
VTESTHLELTHLNEHGEANMVDVAGKPVTLRVARAQALLRMQPATLSALTEQTLAKGDALAVARIAGILAAKKTADLIPLCHPLALTQVQIEFELAPPDLLIVRSLCRLNGRTGVEMEALIGASVAALTVYDMCKAIDRGMQIERLELLEKSGGQRGDWSRSDPLPGA